MASNWDDDSRRDEYARGARWTRGSDDRPAYGRRDDRVQGDSWGERLGQRISSFVRDVQDEYLGGERRRDDRDDPRPYDRPDRASPRQSHADERSYADYGRRERDDRWRDERQGDRGRDRPWERQQSQFGRGSRGEDEEQGRYSGGYGAGDYGRGGARAGGYAAGGSYGTGARDAGGYGTGPGFGRGDHDRDGQGYGARDFGQGAFGTTSGGSYVRDSYGYDRSERRGPKSYTRSDSRIEEDVNEALSRGSLDATEVTVSVKDGEVTLAGSVRSRSDKRRAEDAADDVSGVKHVQNNLRVDESWQGSWGSDQGLGQSQGWRSEDRQGQAQRQSQSGPSQSGQSQPQGVQSQDQHQWSKLPDDDVTKVDRDIPAAAFGVSNPKTS